MLLKMSARAMPFAGTTTAVYGLARMFCETFGGFHSHVLQKRLLNLAIIGGGDISTNIVYFVGSDTFISLQWAPVCWLASMIKYWHEVVGGMVLRLVFDLPVL